MAGVVDGGVQLAVLGGGLPVEGAVDESVVVVVVVLPGPGVPNGAGVVEVAVVVVVVVVVPVVGELQPELIEGELLVLVVDPVVVVGSVACPLPPDPDVELGVLSTVGSVWTWVWLASGFWAVVGSVVVFVASALGWTVVAAVEAISVWTVAFAL